MAEEKLPEPSDQLVIIFCFHRRTCTSFFSLSLPAQELGAVTQGIQLDDSTLQQIRGLYVSLEALHEFPSPGNRLFMVFIYVIHVM